MHSRLRRGVGAPGPAAPEDPVALSGTLGSKAKLRTAMRLLSAAGGLLLLAACEGPGGTSDYRAFAPIPKETLDLMAGDGTTKSAPVLIRTYKKEAELELWKQAKDGRYVKLKTFPMCR
jgi:murein L,D-transpeptidase YafK